MNCPVPVPRVPMLQRGVTVLLEVHWLTETASTRLLNVSATNMVPEGLNAIAIGQLKLLVRRVVFGQLATLTPAVVNSSIRLLRVLATHTSPLAGSYATPWAQLNDAVLSTTPLTPQSKGLVPPGRSKRSMRWLTVLVAKMELGLELGSIAIA